MKESLETLPIFAKLTWRLPYMGEDWGRWYVFFQDRTVAALLDFLPVLELEAGYTDILPPPIRGRLVGPPLRSRSSENMGKVRGDEARPPRKELLSPEMLDDESEMVSARDAGLLRESSSLRRGSMVSRLRFSQPCLILTLARARLLWRTLVILLTCALLSTRFASSLGCAESIVGRHCSSPYSNFSHEQRTVQQSIAGGRE